MDRAQQPRPSLVVLDSDSDVSELEVAGTTTRWETVPASAAPGELMASSAQDSLAVLDRCIATKQAEAQQLWAEVAELEAQRRDLLAMRESERAAKRTQVDWLRTDFAWSPKVDTVRRRLLGHRQFRFHQIETINCTLAGRDSFVVMPTGESLARNKA